MNKRLKKENNNKNKTNKFTKHWLILLEFHILPTRRKEVNKL